MLGDYHAEGQIERSRRNSSKEIVGEHLEYRRVGHVKFSLIELQVAVLEEIAPHTIESHGIDNLRVVVAQLRSKPLLRYRPGECIIRLLDVGHNAVNVRCIFVIAVVAKLVQDVHQQEQAAGDPDRETENVDYGIGPILEKVAEGELDEVLQHTTEV